MKAAQYKEKGKLEIVQLPIPNAGKNQLRIKVKACGICHTDIFVGLQALHNPLPIVPGHEVIGVVDQIGEGSTKHKIGDLVGVGWFGGNACHQCSECRNGDLVLCSKSQVCGLSYNGGYAEYMVAPEDAFAVVPKNYDPKLAACLGCAGVTTFNGIRNLNIPVGSLVAVSGIGGLGHLAVQYCNKMGYEVVALSTSMEKEKLSKQLGAHHYIDTSTATWKEDLAKLGSVKLIVATAPSVNVATELQYCTGRGGKLLILAPMTEPIPVNSINLIANRSIHSSSSGDNFDVEDTYNFSKLHNVVPMIQTYKLEEAPKALAEINKARFRGVIVFDQ
ncbi:zinc-containing alcohol dehydrogenase (ADH) [Tieghemostelium lacteum]|uniref:Zinc-containing alcohol dehydrogenase (ADH) n=1 Tax=Tieghemostelium lacteum TaxID=361077 RepID=A0A151ZDF4_TIELA|nr:zinc-containing alcohol dehydrogenase (ADH) [Tieghemostelium lacteum]|eukprot:KYQ91977.1 zinc-containing alcohol dehydrogenase (ADH) [Tieghemostelium lacteum]